MQVRQRDRGAVRARERPGGVDRARPARARRGRARPRSCPRPRAAPRSAPPAPARAPAGPEGPGARRCGPRVIGERAVDGADAPRHGRRWARSPRRPRAARPRGLGAPGEIRRAARRPRTGAPPGRDAGMRDRDDRHRPVAAPGQRRRVQVDGGGALGERGAGRRASRAKLGRVRGGPVERQSGLDQLEPARRLRARCAGVGRRAERPRAPAEPARGKPAAGRACSARRRPPRPSSSGGSRAGSQPVRHACSSSGSGSGRSSWMSEKRSNWPR